MNMKKRLTAALLVIAFVFGLFSGAFTGVQKAYAASVTINSSNFPDEEFREYVKGFDTSGNGVLEQSELDAVKTIDFAGHADTLTGIKYFTNLETLICYRCRLTSLDLSQNTKLKRLDCYEQYTQSTGGYDYTKGLKSLNISKCTALEHLDAHGNALTSLDLSNNKALRVVYLQYNMLTGVHLGNQQYLWKLVVSGNTNLPFIDIRECPVLDNLTANFTAIDSLDISGSPLLVKMIQRIRNNEQAAGYGLDTSLGYDVYTDYFEGKGRSLYVNKNCGIIIRQPTITITSNKNREATNIGSTAVEYSVSMGDYSEVQYEIYLVDEDDKKVSGFTETNTITGDTTGIYSKDFNGIAPGTYAVEMYVWAPAPNGYLKSVLADQDAAVYLVTDPVPKIYTIIQAGNDGITLKWRYVAGVDGFEIYRKAEGIIEEPEKKVYTVDKTVLEKTDTGLKAGTTYTYRVRGYRKRMIGGEYHYFYTDYSGEVSLTVNPFSDVGKNEGYFTPIAWCYVNGIAKGKGTASNGRIIFGPKDSCERGQFATMIYRLNASPSITGLTEPFNDVKESDGYYNAIVWAYNAGIINGTSKTTFSPHDTCTRAQVVIMLWKMNGKPEPTITKSPFSDVSAKKLGTNQFKAILWASENGIVKGYSDGTFRPGNTCTRGQIATILYKYFNTFMGAWG